MPDLITAEMVDLDLPAADKDATTAHLADLLVAGGRVTDLDGFLADVRGPRAADGHRPPGRHRHPARPLVGTSPCRHWRSADPPTASTSAPPTGPPASSSSSPPRPMGMGTTSRSSPRSPAGSSTSRSARHCSTADAPDQVVDLVPSRGGRHSEVRRRDVVPDGHRAHVHGRRGPGAGGQGRRPRDPGRDPGRRRVPPRSAPTSSPRPTPSSSPPTSRSATSDRFAGKPLGHHAASRSAINDGSGAHRRGRQRRRGGAAPPLPPPARDAHPHRRPRPASKDYGNSTAAKIRGWLMTGVSLHDPVRRRGRHPDRPRLPVRRPDRAGGKTGVVARSPTVPPGRPARELQRRLARSDWAGASLFFRSARSRSASWCRSWPGSSRSASPTGPASSPASSAACSPWPSAPASSAASSAGLIAGGLALLDLPLEGAARPSAASCRSW